MPTPVGHALGALLLTAPIRARYKLLGAGAAAAAVSLGVAPDLDLLAGRHSAETHSVGAAALAGAVVWFVARRRGIRHRTALAAMAVVAVLSHAFLDWLGTDTSAPIGIMALWPFSSAYYESDTHVFMAVSRRYWLDEFWTYNLRVLGRELLILGIPAVAVEWWIRRRRGI
ncbi:MAG: metal-dependent hydrolase [Vicinamibacterales bacterium]